MTISEVSVDELEPALQAGGRLIDVREVEEYVAGHVPGAELIPLGSVPSALQRFATDAPNYVICRSGARSYRACEFLSDQGLVAINVGGGMLAWVTSGRDTVAGDQPA